MMENLQHKVSTLQDSLQSLNLQPEGDQRDGSLDRVLLGKVLITRNFKCFTIAEIVTKTWRVRSKIQIECIAENTFKFHFGCSEKKDYIFNGMPWSINGSHLVLKKWLVNTYLNGISFDWSTFILQVHGLPPALLHAGTTRRMRNKIGKLHLGSLGRKCVVGNRYLRMKIDIEVHNPIPAGFFQDKQNGDKELIQFKCERLSDFFYKCSIIDHVTEK